MLKSRFTYLFHLCVLLVSILVFVPAQAALPKLGDFFNQETTSGFLPVTDAFSLNFSQQENKVLFTWKIADGYYLYQNKITLSSNEAQIGTLTLPEPIPYQDEFFGQVFIYKKELNFSLPLISATDNASLTLGYQGCAEAGFCYPPENITIPLTAFSAKAKDLQLLDYSSSKDPSQYSGSQSTKVTSLSENWWQPLIFFLLGIGLAFTPCVLPMYPILTGIVLGGGKKSYAKTFSLSFVYVQGMALTYTLLGLVVASAGVQFQAALQHPYVLIGISCLFILFASAMFGAFSFQLPASMQTQLAKLSNNQQGGSLSGVFAMGAISGLICSPCTTAPLSGALLYVAQSGDLLTGAVTLYALALGMGIPLILAALFGNKLLPKAGAWMEKIKTLFGFILLCAPLFFLERIFSEQTSTVLWIIWLFTLSAWLYHCSREIIPSKIASLLAVFAIFGISFSSFQSYQLIFVSKNIESHAALPFIQINTVEDLEAQLAKAKSQGKPVLLDFYADWCVACKEYEKYTFSDASVQNELSKYILLQADVTENNQQHKNLLNKMQVLGLPTIDFWNTQGEYINNSRLSGFINADAFLSHLSK